MSVAGRSNEPNKIFKNSSSHWRNDSGELDVFEAARYFSGANENPGYENTAIFSQKFIRNERPHGPIAARISLDMPMTNNNTLIHREGNPVMDQKQLKQNKKLYKQPSSPGGKLASFLNAIFNQTASKKKKKSKSGKDLDQEESPGGPRKRRSSISHFSIITSSKITNDSKSVNSSSSSGFRTPPPCANTPTKSYKEFAGFCDGRVSRPGNDENAEKYRSPIFKNDIESIGFSERNIWAADEEKNQFRKFGDVDDGADSDSSSDLFDLPNHDSDIYSSGLPVYGTTHMHRIRIAAPISSAATV